MIILGNLLTAIASILGGVLSFVTILIIARVVVSWVNADPYNTLVRIITQSTDPLLLPIQRKLGARMGGLDFSPIILLFVLTFLQYFLVQTLSDYGLMLRQSAFQ